MHKTIHLFLALTERCFLIIIYINIYIYSLRYTIATCNLARTDFLIRDLEFNIQP